MSAKAVDKELFHCLAIVYIQDNRQASFEDFWLHMAGYRLSKTVILSSTKKRFNKNVKVTASVLREINTHNLQRGTKPQDVIDLSFFERDPTFSPAKQYIGSSRPLGMYFDETKILKYMPSLYTPHGSRISVNVLSDKGTSNTARFTAQSVFYSAKKLLDSSLVSRSTKYMVLNQDDPFVLKIKDKPLSILKKHLEFSGKVDLMSSVDFYMVAPAAKYKIETEMDAHVNNEDRVKILNNMRQNKHTYRTIINKYFASRQLFGISSKITDNSQIESQFKIIGTTSLGRDTLIGTALEKHIDPYTRLLRHIIEDPKNMSKVIDQVIDIDYETANFRANLSAWSINVDFNFQKIDNIPADRVVFYLEFLGDSGYNGKYVKINTTIKTTWVGGLADQKTIGDIFFRLYADGFTEQKFIDKRKADIDDVTLRPMLEKKIFLTPKEVETAFMKAGYNQSDIDAYFAQSTINLLGDYADVPTSYEKVGSEEKSKNFRKAQFSYFITEEAIRLEVKKKIFLTIYGIITKKGYFTYSDTEMLSLISKKYEEMTKNTKVSVPQQTLVADFSAAPYIMLGSLI